MKTPKGERDRPFWRKITIQDEYMGRMRDMLNNIEREGVIGCIDCKSANVTHYHVKVKAQELLLIKLSIPHAIIKRSR